MNERLGSITLEKEFIYFCADALKKELADFII